MKDAKDFYNRVAPYYDVLRSNSKDYRKEADFFSELVRQLSDENKLRVLDVGCATGELVKELREKSVRVDGIDCSSGMIDLAKAKCSEATFYDGDFLNFDRGDKVYDVVLAVDDFVTLCTDQRDLQRFFKRAHILGATWVVVEIKNYEHPYHKDFYRSPPNKVTTLDSEGFSISVKTVECIVRNALRQWTFKYDIHHKNKGNNETFTIDMATRLYTFEEVVSAARPFFEVSKLFGDYDFQPFTKDAKCFVGIFKRVATR